MIKSVYASILRPQMRTSELIQSSREMLQALSTMDGSPDDLAVDDPQLVTIRSGQDRLTASFRADAHYPNLSIDRKMTVDGKESVTRVGINGSDVQALELTREGSEIQGQRYVSDEQGYIIGQPLTPDYARRQWVLAACDLGA